MNVSKDYFYLKGKNAEKIVHDLAIKTFLTDWCYLTPKLPNGKELCDLLVVFDDIAIIWQIKNLKLNKQGEYNKAEVKKNLRQLSGARRQLFDLRTPLGLENPRRVKENFDPATIKRIYLISVLLGRREEMVSFVEEIRNCTVHVFTKDFTQADEISYGWDSIINRAHEGSSEYEVIARELARPNRFHRRYLSKVYFDAHVRAHNDNTYDLFRRILLGDRITYCFLFGDDPEPREKRKAMLQAICWIARGVYPQNKKVLGIATEKKIRPTCSYDFCLMDIPEWTEENQEYIEQLQKDTGILVNPTIAYTQEDEYPTKLD